MDKPMQGTFIESDMLGTSDAGRILGVTTQRVIQLANEGKLWHFRLSGGQRVFRKDDVERLKRERESGR